MTHTEKVHVMFGLGACAAGLLALWSVYRPKSAARLIWPSIAFVIGLLLFIPVEAHTLSYREIGWWNTLRSVVPDHPESWVSDWLRYASRWHVVQHKIGGFLSMLVGVVEFLRARGRLAAPSWRWALPLLLAGVGLAFGVHGGTAGHLPNRVEQVHHWLLGTGFVAAGVVLALARGGWLRARIWQGLWAVLVLMVGLQITFFYRLPAAARGPAHESPDTRLR